MPLPITGSLIEKLGHKILEIRIRTLKDVATRINRGALQTLEVPAIALFRELIRWFGQEPLCEQATVLGLLKMILESGLCNEVLGHFRTDRLTKELQKIQQILNGEYSKEMLEVINALETATRTTRVTRASYEKPNQLATNFDQHDTIELCESDDECNALSDSDYIRCWEMPCAVDLISLRLINESLHPEETPESHQHAINYLMNALKDYPAEYFLQPPYIFRSLLRLFEHNTDVLVLVQKLTESLKIRVNSLQLSAMYIWNEKPEHKLPRTQISVTKYCEDTFALALDTIKSISQTVSKDTINGMFRIILELVQLLEHHNMTSTISQKLICEFGYLAKYKREMWHSERENSENRIQYIITLFAMCKLLKLMPTELPNEAHPISSSFLSNPEEETCEKRVWMHELNNALLDFPLKHFYPEIYSILQECFQHEITDTMAVLLNCEHNLGPAIEILRQQNCLDDQELVLSGLKAIETLNLHKSIGMVKQLLNAVSNTLPHFERDADLKEAGENIFLQLISHQNIKIKRLAYQEACNKVKHFIATLMEESSIMTKSFAIKSKPSHSIGIPLTVNIMTELICFGYDNSDKIIHESATIMLKLILRGKTLMGNYWDDFLEILIPILPLLQCLANCESPLGQAIIDLCDPAQAILSPFEYTAANVRFLFSQKEDVRSKALDRLILLLCSDESTSFFLPNITNISDTLSNRLLIVDKPIDVTTNSLSGIYDASTVPSLIEMIKSPSTEASIRKAMLIQLNAMASDPIMIATIHAHNGWAYALKILIGILEDRGCTDVFETGIAATGLLSKTLLIYPKFRDLMTKQVNFYFVLLRSLMLYSNFKNARPHCVVALFVFAFSDYIIRNNHIMMPFIFARLQIPIVCKHYWQTSPFAQSSTLENLFTFNYNADNDESKTDKDKYNGCDKLEADPERAWQFLRLSFASVWFDGFDNLVEYELRKECDDHKSVDYSNLAGHLCSIKKKDETIEMNNILDFSRKLKLKVDDVNLIKTTMVGETVLAYLKKIENATGHEEVLAHILRISQVLILPTAEKLPANEILKTLKRFLFTYPNNERDEQIFISIQSLFELFVKKRSRRIIAAILNELNGKSSVYLKLLALKNLEKIDLFSSNCHFIRVLFNELITWDDAKMNDYVVCNELPEGSAAVSAKSTGHNLYNNVFLFVGNLLESNRDLKSTQDNKCDPNRIRCLISVLRTLAASDKLRLSESYLNRIANRMIFFITAMKNFTQGGADFIKNGLYTIANLMDKMNQLSLEMKYLKLIAGFCGHNDSEIRIVSWMIMRKISSTLTGAFELIKALSFLPGGYHACCLSTAFDKRENAFVKQSAARVFANLIAFGNDGKLHMSAAPLCDHTLSSINEDPISLLMIVIKRHQLFENVRQSIQFYYSSEIVELAENRRLTTSLEILSYLMILENLITLKQEIVQELIESCIVYDILSILPKASSTPTRSSFALVTGICNFIGKCIFENNEALELIIGYDRSILSSILFMLNLKLYDNLPVTTMYDTCSAVMEIIPVIVCAEVGYESLITILLDKMYTPLIVTLLNGLKLDQNRKFQENCLRFIYALLRIDSQFPNRSNSFVKMLGEYALTDDFHSKESLKRQGKKSAEHFYGNKLIFNRLLPLFDMLCARDKPEQGAIALSNHRDYCFATMQELLQSSQMCRQMATAENLLSRIQNRLDAIVTGLSSMVKEFPKRGAQQKRFLVADELISMLKLISNWYSGDILKDVTQIANLCRTSLSIWPWTHADIETHAELIKMLINLSENSIPVCQGLATVHLRASSDTILVLLVKTVIDETKRVKSPNRDMKMLHLSFRILMNCCACVEGRNTIMRLKIFDSISAFHPSITKQQKFWNPIISVWLEFWEILSRYPEGNGIRHLSLLCTLAVKSTPEIHTRALSILRNQSFASSNRVAILASPEYMAVVQWILDSGNCHDCATIMAGLRALITNHHKAKHVFKNSTVPAKLNKLIQTLAAAKVGGPQNEEDYKDLVIVHRLLTK